MANVRRVNARDIAKHGGLENLVLQLIDKLRIGNMETKERAAMHLRSLTEQPRGKESSPDADNAVLIARQNGIKPLVSLVIIGSAVAQTHACAALANIAKDRTAYQEAVLEAGGVLPICSALRGGDSHSQEQAAAALASLSQLEVARKPIIKVGGIPPLVALLKGASADTQIHAAKALANLSRGSAEGQSIIARAGALPLLINLLVTGKTQEAVAHAVACLTQDHEANQAEVTLLGGIPKLVALLSVVSAEAQAQAAAALAAVASGENQHEKDVIAKAGGIRPLLALIDSRYTHTQRCAINAIAMLALDHRDNQDSIATLDGIMPLVLITQAGGAYPSEVQQQTVLALTEIARHNRENQTAVVQFGAISSLVNLLKHSNSPIVEAEVAGVMWALAENHTENQVAVASAGSIPLLMPQLASINERAQANAAHAIASLSLRNVENQAQSTSLLVGLLEEGSVDTQARAAELLWRIVSENPEGEPVIAKAGGAEQLVRLLSSKLPRAKSYALWSLSLSIDQDSQKLVADAGGIQPLVNMLNADCVLVNEQAACALQLLAQKNRDTQTAIAMHGAIEPLIALLDRDGSDRSQEHAAATLSDLALIPANKAAIDRGGGIEPLVALLSDTRRQPQSKKYAAAALARLSNDEGERRQRNEQKEAIDKQRSQQRERKKSKELPDEIIPSTSYRVRATKAEVIAEAGAIRPLVDLLSGERGSEAQEEAAGALWALANYSSNRKAITDCGGIGPLVELLGCPNFKAREHAEAALVRLSIENVNRVLIIKQLVEMLQESSGTAAQEQAAAALANLARESTENRTSILDAGGIPRLLTLLHSNSPKAKENAVSAIAQLAYKSLANQNEIAEANGIPSLVSTLISASQNVKELSFIQMCTLTASAIWNLADQNPTNQTLLNKEGAIPPIVALVTNPSPEMQTNAAGALAVLAREHPDNQGAIARAGAIAPLCTMVRDGSSETREESAAALWTLATNNAPNKATIAKLGGIEPLVNMLMHGISDKSSINAANALAALARQHSENCATIIKRMVTTISSKAPPPRAVRLLNAVACLCDNEPMNQITMSKVGGIQPLIPWLESPQEEVQIQAARAVLALASNNATTQSLIGKLGGVKPLVVLIDRGPLEAQVHAACALWHLATLGSNRTRIGQASGFAPLVSMLIADGDRAPQLATMLVLRLAEGSTKAVNSIAQVGGILPLVKLLTSANMATQQMAAASLSAIGNVSQHRNTISNSGAVRSLISLLTSRTLGTPETAARALGCLARNDGDDVEVAEVKLDDEGETGCEPAADEDESAANQMEATADYAAADDEDGDEKSELGDESRTPERRRKLHALENQPCEAAPAIGLEVAVLSDEEEESNGGEARRMIIHREGGVPQLIAMLDGSNLVGKDGVLKPLVVGGWSALKIGIEGCIESREIFPGSQVDFGVRIGMQEQAASTLSDLADGDSELQDAIIESGGVAPLLSLVRSGSSLAQEFSARSIWYLSSSIDNQRTVVASSTIVDLVQLLKGGSQKAQYMAAAGLSELAHGAIMERQGRVVPLAPRGSGGTIKPEVQGCVVVGSATSSNSWPEGLQAALPTLTQKGNRLMAINEAGGIVPLVKLAEHGTAEGKEKAASAMWHLALDRENQTALAANGAIKPLVALLADGTAEAKRFASAGLTRLALDNPDNQAQIAKRLVGLLDHDDSNVVSLAAFDLQSLAQDHPGAPIVIVNAGAISPLVSVLSNGKTDEGRNQAAKTLHTLANSGPANQLAIAIGLVALLGVGTDQAQEYVTQLLLTLTSGGDAEADMESALLNRRAIANAGPFRMLVMQLRSDSPKVKMLASAVLSKLSGDSEQNVTEIANVNGIPPLVALQGEGDDPTKQNVTAVLADMTRNNKVHASAVVKEGGIVLTVALLAASDSIETQAYAADMLGSIAIEHALEIGASGAITPLVNLLTRDSKHAKQKAARALAGIAAGGKVNQDGVKEAGGVELLVGLLRATDENVQSMSAGALAELARNNSGNQLAITECGGIEPLIALVTNSTNDQPKADAARTLWSLSDKNHTNQVAIAQAGGIRSLISLVGAASEGGQIQASGAIVSLALDNPENLTEAATLLVKLLADSKRENESRENAARAISHFARANSSNQDALALAGCSNLLVSQLEPRVHEEQSAVSGILGSTKSLDSSAEVSGSGKHHLTQKELCGALWSVSLDNASNQIAAAKAGGIPLLISLLDDHPDIRRDAAGALWSLGADSDNQRLIAEEGGIPKLVDLLRFDKKNYAQDTAAGALHILAARPENRVQIADADGISLLIPLFEGGSSDAQSAVSGALLTLVIGNPSNQFNIATKLVALLANGPENAQEVLAGQNTEMKWRVMAQEHATRVLYTMTLERDYKEAISRTGAISQLVRQLKGGTEATQQMASNALSQIARMSSDLRIQVTQQLVTLLGSPDAEVRQRAGAALRENNSSDGGEDAKHQREAAMAGGVAPLVELLKAGLSDDRVEAQEYSLWSLSMSTDATRRRSMVEEGCIPALIQSLRDGKLREDSKEHAAMVIASLSLDGQNREEIIHTGAITQLVDLLIAEQTTMGAKRQAAQALARLSHHSRQAQDLIADSGAITPLVKWLGDADAGPSAVAAIALSDLAHDNRALQLSIAEADALPRLVTMLSEDASTESHEAACSALANLARDMPSIQDTIAQAGGIPPIVELLMTDYCQEQAANAISTLADRMENKMLILKAGGIRPLVALLNGSNPTTQRHTAKAIESLARDSSEIQDVLATERASTPLVGLLASESIETQESAVRALLCLASHPASRTVVVVRLVGVLLQRNTGAQLKAAEALAVLAARSSANRTAIVHAGAIEPLVTLLGNGMQSQLNTPPERSAAVLAELARFSESKVEISKAGGIGPLVAMLGSTCDEARTHAAYALRHLSATIENKAIITDLDAIPRLVVLLSNGTPDGERHAACALWQLATTAEAKASVVEAGGIRPLVELLHDHSSADNLGLASSAKMAEAEDANDQSATVASKDTPSTPSSRSAETKEAAAAMLSELARSQGNRTDIVKAGGVPPLVALMKGGTLGAQKYAASTLWGISQENKYRRTICDCSLAIDHLVGLLRKNQEETQGFAASTLVCLAQEKEGRGQIKALGGAGPLMTIALGPTSWLRSRCVEVLKLLGYPDPVEQQDTMEKKPLSPRFSKHQEKLAKNPAIWMVPDVARKQTVNDEHMADLACKLKEGDRVVVDPGSRKAEVRFVGKIPEIAKGYWVGVQYDEPVGKNDGSIKGRRCFECTHDFGGFLRPNHIRVDMHPPARRARPAKVDDPVAAGNVAKQEGSSLPLGGEGPVAQARKGRRVKDLSAVVAQAVPLLDTPIVLASAHDGQDTDRSIKKARPASIARVILKKQPAVKEEEPTVKEPQGAKEQLAIKEQAAIKVEQLVAKDKTGSGGAGRALLDASKGRSKGTKR